jgi:hypothetical protein
MAAEPTVDVAEFVSDYWTMLRDSGERMPSRKALAQEIATALLDYGVTVTPKQVAYYL